MVVWVYCELSTGLGIRQTRLQRRAISVGKMRCTKGKGKGQGEGVPSTLSCKPELKKGLWSPDEDKKLTNYIMKNGLMGCWSYVSEKAGLQRCGKSCRLRWINYLRPGLKRGAISRQEQQQIIYLQSILGNRWSQIAAYLRGRTDNEIKNYWNSCIKKKLKSKHHLHFSSTDTKSKISSKSHRICNTNSGFPHADDAFTSSHSAQPSLEVMPEGYQPPNTTCNTVTTGENQFCVPDVLELEDEQVQDLNHKFSIDRDPTNSQLISYSHLGIDSASSTHTHTHDTFSTDSFMCTTLQAQGHHNFEIEKSACKQIDSWNASTLPQLPHDAKAGSVYNYSLGCTITVPADLTGSELMKEKLENNIDGEIFNENEIMIDYSPFSTAASSGLSGWSASYSYSNIAADCSQVFDPEAYIATNEPGISILEDYESLYEKTTSQSCPPLNSRSHFSSPAIRQQFNSFQGEDDCKDSLNLRYDVHLAVPTYIDINSSHQLQHIDGSGGGGGDQWDFSGIPCEEANTNPIPTILEGCGPLDIERKVAVAGQVTVWAHDHIYNINTAAVSDLHKIYFG